MASFYRGYITSARQYVGWKQNRNWYEIDDTPVKYSMLYLQW
jgi:hypothetical protein